MFAIPFYNCSSTTCPMNDNMAGNNTTDYTTAGQKALLNILPSSRFDPNAVALLALLPLPERNLSPRPYRTTGISTPTKIFSADQYDGRIDEKISNKDSIWGSYSHYNPIASATAAYPGPAEGALRSIMPR